MNKDAESLPVQVRIARCAARVVILFAASACAQTAHPPQASAVKPRPNVLLITIDTVRADHLSCYGAKNIETPTLDALARDGVVFERAISQVPLTWPSHAVMLTGLYPFQNGVQDFTGQPLDAKFRSVAQAFQEQGYSTGAVVSSFVLDRSWGLARGFDDYDDAFDAQQFVNRDPGLVERRAGESVDRALRWLRQARRPFFLWLHLYDPHSPYDPPEPYRSRYSGRPYDGEIAYADHELGRVISWLKRNGLYERSLILFASDHGESLGEHGEQEHGFFVYDSTVQVPLIVKPPAASGIRPGRRSRPVETSAVASTLLVGAGIDGTLGGQTQSTGLLGPGSGTDDAAYSETFYPFSSFGWSPLHALETSRYHYIDAPQPELYDLTADPEENNNIAAQQPATVAVFKEKLQRLLAERPYAPAADQNAHLSPDAIEKLRALGYVAYRSPVSALALASGLPDPKSKLWEFNTILAAEDALRTGDTARGKTLLLQVREKDPEMYIVPFALGEAALAERNWDEAAAELRRCLQLNPRFDQAMLALSRALAAQEKTEEARQWAKSAIEYNAQNYHAWYQLGSMESRTDHAAALADYEKAVAIQSGFAPAQRDLGLLQLQDRAYVDAAKHLSRAIELGLEDANVDNALGIAYSRTGRAHDAIESYKRALKLDPDLAQAHLNLGFAYEGIHEEKLAAAEYARACELKQDLCATIARHRQKPQ